MKKFLIVLLCFMAMGEISEIAIQSVSLNNYIQQAAVIELVQEYGDNLMIPCPDCTCNMTVYDKNINIVFQNRPMISEGNALFGYNATSANFIPGQKYYAIANCTSIIYNGSGYAYSSVTIISNNSFNACSSYDLVCNTQNLILYLAAIPGQIASAISGNNNYLKQIYQIQEDLLLSQNGNANICQLMISNQSNFASLELNRHTYTSEYTYDEYMPPGSYFWRVRCKKGQEWGMWSDIGNFTHATSSIYFDWTIK